MDSVGVEEEAESFGERERELVGIVICVVSWENE